VSRGKDALAEVTVEISVKGRRHHGKSISTDTMEASAQAFLNALNKADTNAGPRLHPQKEPAAAPEVVPASP
jgi:2-isopropylmalate synthase